MEEEIKLEDLKKEEYSKSFDELLAKAKELATKPGEELDILTDWIWHDFTDVCCREGQSSTSIIDHKENTAESRPCIVKNKMKVISTPKPCSDIGAALMIRRNGENEDASHHPSSASNDEQMNQKQSPYASCSRGSEDQDECFNHHKEASSPHSSAWRKRKRQLTEDQDGYYYTYAGEAGNMMMNSTKKKVKKPRALPIDGPPPELPMEFRNKIESMHGSEAKLVIHKVIRDTDVSDHHDRLNLPRNQVLTMEVLNEQELEQIGRKHGVEVRVIEPCLEEGTLQLRRWSTPNGSYNYVLNSGWRHVVRKDKNNIVSGNTIQVWSFRVDDPGEVWFALVCPGAGR